jgi:hypothetical protein
MSGYVTRYAASHSAHHVRRRVKFTVESRRGNPSHDL